MIMTLDEYLNLPNSETATSLANRLGEKLPNLSMWRSGKKPIPKHKAVLIEQCTNGAVTRKDIFPDNWHLIWPELVEQNKKGRLKRRLRD